MARHAHYINGETFFDPAAGPCVLDEGPDAGHRFEIAVRSSGSYGIAGEPGHHDSDWWSEPKTVVVRAWDLPAALRRAAQMHPIADWEPRDEDVL